MTREEAIDRLMWLKDLPHINDNKWIEAIDMAIEALHREEAEEKGYCHRIRQSNVEVVVRCKDCRYLGIKDFVYGYCKKNMVGEVEPDDYCSYGERRRAKK